MRPPAFRRSLPLADGQTAYEELWEVPSDPRAKVTPSGTIRAWAVLAIRWSPVLRQMCPELRRVYTRNWGGSREVSTICVQALSWAVPASGPDDVDARVRCADVVRSGIIDALDNPDVESLLTTGARRVFLAVDVLN